MKDSNLSLTGFWIQLTEVVGSWGEDVGCWESSHTVYCLHVTRIAKCGSASPQCGSGSGSSFSLTCGHFTLMRILWTQASMLSRQASIMSVHSPRRLYFEPLKLRNFVFNADGWSGFCFQSGVDPDSPHESIYVMVPGYIAASQLKSLDKDTVMFIKVFFCMFFLVPVCGVFYLYPCSGPLCLCVNAALLLSCLSYQRVSCLGIKGFFYFLQSVLSFSQYFCCDKQKLWVNSTLPLIFRVIWDGNKL